VTQRIETAEQYGNFVEGLSKKPLGREIVQRSFVYDGEAPAYSLSSFREEAYEVLEELKLGTFDYDTLMVFAEQNEGNIHRQIERVARTMLEGYYRELELAATVRTF
jgi:hypothetical protein